MFHMGGKIVIDAMQMNVSSNKDYDAAIKLTAKLYWIGGSLVNPKKLIVEYNNGLSFDKQ